MGKYVSYPPKLIEQVREIDLLSYLQRYEPDNLKKVSGNVYCTAEHDSLKISNGKWYWWSRGFGGVSALDYLIKVREMSFVQAMEILSGYAPSYQYTPTILTKTEEKVLSLPLKNNSCNIVIEYLFKRGIDYELINNCIADGLIYESANYHNAVFVGKDENGTARYASCRSTQGYVYKGDASGSDKSYSFRLLSHKPKNSLRIFESAIDLLSYATYMKCKGRDYKSENMLSLSGVFRPKNNSNEIKIPATIKKFLEQNHQIKVIYLHMDNDKAGRIFTAAIKEKLQNSYKIVDAPPPVGKDVNDFLMHYLGISKEKSSMERSDAR